MDRIETMAPVHPWVLSAWPAHPDVGCGVASKQLEPGLLALRAVRSLARQREGAAGRDPVRHRLRARRLAPPRQRSPWATPVDLVVCCVADAPGARIAETNRRLQRSGRLPEAVNAEAKDHNRLTHLNLERDALQPVQVAARQRVRRVVFRRDHDAAARQLSADAVIDRHLPDMYGLPGDR